MQLSEMFNMLKNAFLQCFHHQVLKSTLETQIKAYAVVANAQHAENAFLHCFHHQILKTAFETQINAYAAVAIVHHAEKRVFSIVLFIIF